jgi:CCR4-NOT transcriptional complex subunit CAF120
MWNSDLDAPHLGLDPNESQKFVQLEPGNAQMTKAFTPHGLLQAGLQDKEDRSAKRQEENAKESGSSLVNVPNKPPPPQAGLLGAITAHERDRKAPGGIGAALTERERDRRLAVRIPGFPWILSDVCALGGTTATDR